MVESLKPTDVEAGPFENEPSQLGSYLSDRFSGRVDGDTVRERCESWLLCELDRAGVALGSADRDIVATLAADGWSVVQIVRGWVVRAKQGGGS